MTPIKSFIMHHDFHDAIQFAPTHLKESTTRHFCRENFLIG